MSARRAVIYTMLFFILLPVYLYSRPALSGGSTPEEAREKVLDIGAIDAITITRGAETIRFRKTADGSRYELVVPAGKFIPQDLMSTVAQSLSGTASAAVVADHPADLTQFGLDHPTSGIAIEAAGKPKPVTIVLGAENPTRTAIYAQVEGVPKVFLLGKDLEYYEDLMFQWIEGKQGKNA
jgi:uncharacterized protein DUF4340